MRGLIFFACILLFLPACGEGGKYSAMRPEFGGAVEFPGWPALPKGVAGYNLYLAPKPEGPWEKINDTPLGGGRMMVPYLEPGREYCFRLTAVTPSGKESAPGGILKKKAVPKP